MFLNFLERLLTPCPKPVRAMGYLKEALGVARRYRRCREHWKEHIEHCRSIILRAVEGCWRRRRVVILGGGMLHDVPLIELAEDFREVYLVDIVHPFSSRWKTRRIRNLTRVAADVTNTVEELYWVSDEPDKPLPESHPDLFLDDPEVDLTISLNLLSQLPCMPLDYLSRFHAHRIPAREEYARNLIRAHLEYLDRLPGRVALITDVERIKIDLTDHVVERKDLLFGLKLPKLGEEWEWRLAPCPEADSRHHFYRRVAGIAEWK
jgi:hypothetical protein